MKIQHHMSCNIEGLLRNYKKKKINFIEDGKGNLLSDSEARKVLADFQKKGFKLIPVDDCKGFDPFENGCPGHEIES